MKKICLIGNLGNAGNENNGQTVKTKTIIRAVTEKYGDVLLVADTNRVNNGALESVLNILKAAMQGDLIVLAVCNFAVGLLALPLYCIARIRRKKIAYILIGGWLGDYIKKHKIAKWVLKQYDVIFAETYATGEALVEQGFTNVEYMDNCKYLEMQTGKRDSAPDEIRLCTLSRVVPEKGIEDAIDAVKAVNNSQEQYKFLLDIYGEAEEHYKHTFFYAVNQNSDYVSYRGVIAPLECPTTLRKYDALVFPTRVKTEGMPGTVIDAMFAGTPVIAVDWNACREVIMDGYNGLIYSWDDRDLDQVLCQPDLKNVLQQMEVNCFEVAKRFTPQVAMQPLFDLYERTE